VGEEHDAGPPVGPATEPRRDGIRDRVDEAIDERLVIQDGLRRVASLETGSGASSESIDGPGEVAEEVAGPGSELTFLVVHHEVEMIRQDAYGEDAEVGELVLGAGEPLEDGEVEFRVGAEKEAGLVAAGGDQVVLAGGLSSERSSHGVGESKTCAGCRGTSFVERCDGDLPFTFLP